MNAPRRQLQIWIAGIWVLDFAIYSAISSYLGGDAVNGHIAAGHYYLMAHGQLTEVTHSVYRYSLWHTYILVTHLIITAVWIGLIQVPLRRR